MKRILWVVIPLGLVGLLFAAHAALSFGGGRHHHGMFGDFMAYRLEKMSKELNLDQKQQAKMDALKAEMQNMIDGRMEKHQQLRDTFQQQVESGSIDIKQLRPMIDAEIDDKAAAAHNLVGRLEDFYDQLNPDQKKMLADHFKEHMQERQERMNKWKKDSQ